MTLQEALSQLQSAADAKVRAMHIKNGADANTYGAKMGDIRKIAAKIKSDHALAVQLWDTGILDARLLALLIMKPKDLTRDNIDRMVRQATFAWLADWLNNYIVKKHPEKESLRTQWMHDADPWAARAGWTLTSERIGQGAEGVDIPAMLSRIEQEMAKVPAPTQWTMNSALANIGIHFAEHRKRALAIGEKLGVYRDYPVSKGCTSPFAPIWIEEMVKRKA